MKPRASICWMVKTMKICIEDSKPWPYNFRDHGATCVDDAWIKRKYINALLPFEPIDLKSLQGRHNFHSMTSNEVMQEMSAFKVAAKNAQDARARAMGMHKGPSLALKANVVEH